MSKKLAKLLAEPEAKVTKAVAKFEQLCGYPSEDVRLLAENKQKLRAKMIQLGLDPDDTTDEELYYALRARFDRDSQMISRAMGVTDDTALDERIAKATQLVSHCAQVDEVWVVKNSVAKTLLTKNPPKHVLKKLHYRSVSSLIKREDVGELYLLAAAIESETWQKTIDRQLAKLNTSDYELRPVKIVNLPKEKWADMDGPDSYLAVDKRTGVVSIWPSADLHAASALQLTLLLLEGLQAVNPDGYTESLPELSPALRWWADSNHLISEGQQPISFNLKDVALNHLKNHDFKDAAAHHGAQSLWQNLTDRYKQISDSLSEAPQELENNLGKANTSTNLPVSSELAAEYVTVE